MRNLWRASLGLVFLALVASPALAQPGRGGFSPAALLTNKSVQEELKVGDDQKKKIEDLSKKVGDSLREKTKDLKREDREKRAEAMKEVSAEMDKMLPGVLKSDQIKRFKQIRVQQMRSRAFSDPDIQKALKLTDDQTKKIKEINDAAAETIKEKTKDLGMGDFQKRLEIMQQVGKETKDKVVSTLTSEQKKIWKDMVGDPFEVKFERPRPGGGGGRPQPRPDLSK